VSKWTRSEIEEIRALLNEAIDDVDAAIIRAIRDAGRLLKANEPLTASRENLLSQLDVLETVRERLNVRYDRNNHDQ
jgi:hypothetical protein